MAQLSFELGAYPGLGATDRKITKFYNFAGDDARSDTIGTQQHFVDLSGGGMKPKPTACIICHGGRNETLVYRCPTEP